MLHHIRPATLTIVLLVAAGAFCGSARAVDAGPPARPAWLWPTGDVPDKTGKVQLYPDTFGDATPEGITLGPDGALWFTDTGNDYIGRIDASGTYTNEFDANDELSNGITTGPDGALWFTSYGQIGRITTAGDITYFADKGGEFPQQITTGPDGALWFTESNGTIGRITTAGVVSHFTVAASTIMLEGITTGPDGALWATEFENVSMATNIIVRLTTDGKAKTYKVGLGPKFICVGPDGALWFTEYNPVIGRITTTGQYSSYAIPSQYFAPSGIATGPDGALWFTDFGGSGLGRVTTSGTFTLYPISGFPEIEQIVAGPKRSMWFSIFIGRPGIGRIGVGR